MDSSDLPARPSAQCRDEVNYEEKEATLTVRSIGIISKPKKGLLERVIPTLLEWLAQRGIQARMDEESAKTLDDALRSSLTIPVVSRSELAAQSDMILVLGGDGTLLAAARNVLNRNIPVLAVNLGGLGFLTAVTIDELYSTLELVLEGKHQIEQRKMLQIEVIRSGSIVATYHALNDAVLNKAAIARILDFQAFVDRKSVV